MVEFHPVQPYRPTVTLAEAITTQAFEKPLEADYPVVPPTPDYSFQHVLNPERFTIRKLSEEERLMIASKELAGFIEQQLLIREDQPAAYVYCQKCGTKTHTGIVGGFDWRAYANGQIKQHEQTHPSKNQALLRFFQEIGINATPVLMAHKDDNEIEALKAEFMGDIKLYNFSTKDGTQHAVWRITDQSRLSSLKIAFEKLESLYIADGHHRSYALSAYAQAQTEKGKPAPPLLSYALPASDLNINSFHRFLHNLPGDDPEAFLRQASEFFEIEVIEGPQFPAKEGEITVCIHDQWYKWTVRSYNDKTAKTYRENLDVYILDQRVLKQCLSGDDDQGERNLRYVEGTMRLEALQRKANEEACDVICLLHPLSVDTLMTIADAGETLPPKSTWIEPKLRSGLFTQPL